ncbi:MAG TPA: protein translocase subunit SecF [Marmoricola sp.]|jgi:preprotein translocase subunit SecF|nr:protein translocase subunit SecF [Marmoricola sp.]
MAGGGIAGRLYRGDVSINFVGRQRLWYAISGVFALISAIALLVRGLNFSLEFKGGSSFTFPATSSTTQGAISRVVSATHGGDASVQFTSTPSVHQWTVQTGALTSDVTQQVAAAIGRTFHIAATNISIQLVGPTWGGQITSKALEALIIFLVVIVIYLSIAFEWRMAVAAFIALLHDILITVGIYALTGFTVSPTSVIGLLTILGYSLYDTVVVFDKVRENTAGLLTTQRSTYSDAANLALNQTLVRSINTSLTALLPVASILFIGAGLLGAGTLKDLALVLFIGMLSGTYSSIFIATPVLANLKEREPQYKDLAAKVNRRLAGGRSTRRAETDSATAATAATLAAAAPAAATAVTVSGLPVESADQEQDQDQHQDEAAEQDSDDGMAVPAAAARAGDTPPRAVTRQQRVTGGTQRRPGARKKRR